jgi:hypothetical protein
VLTDALGQRHELVFAELTVVVFVELCEQLGWVWRLRTAAAFGPAGTCLAAFAGLLTRLLAALSSAAHLAHFFASFGTLCVV